MNPAARSLLVFLNMRNFLSQRRASQKRQGEGPADTVLRINATQEYLNTEEALAIRDSLSFCRYTRILWQKAPCKSNQDYSPADVSWSVEGDQGYH